jgi:hypothetical protein
MNLKRAIFFAILAVSQNLLAGGEPTCSVGGRVLKATNQDQGIDKVEITLYRDSHEIGNGQSGGDGSYSISCTPGSVITTVRYDHDDWIVSKVENISGKNSHTIYKTLLARSKSFTSSEVQEILATLERLYEIDKQNGTVAKQSSNYLSLLKTIDEKAPPDLKDRIRLLRDRYSK